GAINLYTASIRAASPSTCIIVASFCTSSVNNQTVVESFDADKERQTVGHELGHAMGIPHWQFSQSNGRAATVMVTLDYFVSLTNWQNIPHDYDAIDKSNFHIKP